MKSHSANVVECFTYSLSSLFHHMIESRTIHIDIIFSKILYIIVAQAKLIIKKSTKNYILYGIISILLTVNTVSCNNSHIRVYNISLKLTEFSTLHEILNT